MLTKAGIEQYFIAERNAGMLLLIIGIAAMVIAVIFFIFLKTPLYKGAAWPLVILGVVQMATGYSIYVKSDKQRIDVVYAYDMNPGKLKAEELPRIEKAVKGITVFLALEFILLAAGVVLLWTNRLFFVNIQIGSAFRTGTGIALIIQALLLSGIDYSAYKRGSAYREQLRQFVAKK
ncbi:hypothetical protein [Agriterribacter sp.]|uniref:hypothetical protein n=1 Tax=Agriterribacter sp. TaxID=2821509 RepID=UPI002CE586D8|nr:hypothetical protein [Agriterribacter sp.]HRO44857.1 hypothetical protein [Agriterribacter sp.]HRQ18564.1 hypothetical protein [Agriterribacter sp.]